MTTTSAGQDVKRDHQKFAEQHLGFVRQVAHKFTGTLDFEELMSIGTLGLMKAIERFDSSSGTAFGSYAVPMIRGEILHYLRDKVDVIRTTRGHEKKRVGSLDATIAQDSKTTLLDTIANPASYSQDDDLDPDRKSLFLSQLNQLPYPLKEALILTRINGLTQEEAAQWLDRAAMSVSRYIQTAEQQLKHFAEQPQFKTSSKQGIRNALPCRDEEGLIRTPAYKAKCAACGNVFGIWEKPTHPPQCCSGTCSYKLGHKGDKHQVWELKELDYLKSLVGKMPSSQICKTFQQTASEKGWASRTETAIRVKLERIAKSVRPIKDGWNMRTLARLLDVPLDRIRIWKKRGLKVAATVGGRGGCSIRRDDLHEFCTTDGWRFAGIHVEKLTIALGDRALAEKCANQPLKAKSISVQRLDTKKVYPSLRASARDLKCNKTRIKREVERRADDRWIKVSHVETVGQASLPPVVEDLRERSHLIDSSLPLNLRVLRSPDGKLYKTNNLSWFARVHHLQATHLYCLLKGQGNSHKGWTRPFEVG